MRSRAKSKGAAFLIAGPSRTGTKRLRGPSACGKEADSLGARRSHAPRIALPYINQSRKRQ
jgi:hypothetical protein